MSGWGVHAGRCVHECGYLHRPELSDLPRGRATDGCEQSDWVLATELGSSARWTRELTQVLLSARQAFYQLSHFLVALRLSF